MHVIGRRYGEAMTFLRLIALLSIALIAAGCGSDEEARTPSPERKADAAADARSDDTKGATGEKPTPKTGHVPGGSPIECLEGAELENAEQRDETSWRATNPDTGTLVRVERFADNAAAANAVADASDVIAAVAGPYAVFGAAKGAMDDPAVAMVAGCLPQAS